MTDVNQTFSQNVRYFRRKKGMTIDQLAEKLAWPSGRMTDLENRKRSSKNPTLKLIHQVAEALEVEPGLLLDANAAKPPLLSTSNLVERYGVSRYRVFKWLVSNPNTIRVGSDLYILENHLPAVWNGKVEGSA